MRLVSLLTALSCVSLVYAVPARRTNHVLHEKRATDPEETDWVQSRKLEGHKVLPMRFGLTQQNLHLLEEMLMKVSHPDSPDYAQHYSPAEVASAFAPHATTISAVTDWLVDSGISKDRLRLTAGKGWIEVNATVAEVEELINTEYHVYTHPETGLEQISESYFCRFLGIH